jgi:CheY-like chemotaxis protein
MNTKDSALSGLKILIVDDEADAREFTTRILTLYHAEVVAAGTAAEGLEQVQVHRSDVIVSDISMPQTDGYQFIRNVRNLSAHNGGDTPAVALTAFNRAEDRTKAINAGFQRHLSKPVELQTLIDTLASVAGQYSVKFR